MVPLSMTLMTLDRDFKVAIFFDIKYLETTRDRAIVTRPIAH